MFGLNKVGMNAYTSFVLTCYLTLKWWWGGGLKLNLCFLIMVKNVAVKIKPATRIVKVAFSEPTTKIGLAKLIGNA
jgi:hypothetical protein